MDRAPWEVEHQILIGIWSTTLVHDWQVYRGALVCPLPFRQYRPVSPARFRSNPRDSPWFYKPREWAISAREGYRTPNP